jgi:hypothetical protein
MTYYRVGHPTQSEAIPRGPDGMIFRWHEGRLANWGMTFGGYSLSGVLDAMLDIKSQQIEGPSTLLETSVPGDWIFRPDVPKRVAIEQLTTILRDELGMNLRMEFRTVDRDVYVARGSYKFAPIAGQPAHEKLHLTDKTIETDPVQIFGAALVPNSGSGGGTGDFQEFLQWLGRWIGRPIVSEVTMGPARQISWQLHERSPSTDQTRSADHDPALVLPNISVQTNLRFTLERHKVELLFIEPAQ